jgi:hypothetical protein
MSQRRNRTKQQKSFANQKKNSSAPQVTLAKRTSDMPTRHATKARTNQKGNDTAPTARRDTEKAATFRKMTIEEQSKAWWDLIRRG